MFRLMYPHFKVLQTLPAVLLILCCLSHLITVAEIPVYILLIETKDITLYKLMLVYMLDKMIRNLKLKIFNIWKAKLGGVLLLCTSPFFLLELALLWAEKS